VLVVKDTTTRIAEIGPYASVGIAVWNFAEKLILMVDMCI
jgi:hypothetical protein